LAPPGENKYNCSSSGILWRPINPVNYTSDWYSFWIVNDQSSAVGPCVQNYIQYQCVAPPWLTHRHTHTTQHRHAYRQLLTGYSISSASGAKITCWWAPYDGDPTQLHRLHRLYTRLMRRIHIFLFKGAHVEREAYDGVVGTLPQPGPEMSRTTL